ncbi:MAG TPA: hypothetical protein VK449_09440, partial [Anaerolineales bacterium]|nr:hypothetical protein [Anaerolineales bacterium]
MTPSGTSRRPTDRAGLRAALRRPPDAISLGDGFSLPTRWRTISRWQRALLDRDEFPLLQRQAEQRAARVAPNPHRMLLAIVCGIDAAATDEAGRRVPAVSRLLPAEVDTCRRHFANFMTQVFVGSGGALRVEATELVLDEPARQMSAVGENHWWLSPADAFAGRESVIPGDTFDSIAVLYKMPPRVAPALHGGAVGRDPGLRGSAAWSLWVTDWAEAPGFFNSTTIAALHEWLHNVSFYAHRVMGDRAVPDCHAGEEYGYWDTDGGYRQWQAWNRDLMLHYIPSGFWTRLTARGRLLPPDGAQHR